MIGIVVVSHSPRLAQAAVDLALEMVSGARPSIAIAAGAGDGIIGTDAVRVSEAIAEVASPDGVLVMMDLGSAVLSAEMALEFDAAPGIEVRLTSAPFVEGLLAAVVRAAGGASLDDVEREAVGALGAKQSQLGQAIEPSDVMSPAGETAAADGLLAPDVRETMTLRNPAGLHARPVADLLGAISSFDARVTIANLRTGKPAVLAAGPTALLTLAAREGDDIEVGATGPDAAAAVTAIRALVEDGFGELGELPHTPSAVAVPAPVARRGTPMGVSAGRAAGPVVHMPEPVVLPAASAPIPLELRRAEADRIAAAAAAVAISLSARAARVTGAARAIIEATALIAADPTLTADAELLVLNDGETAVRAVWVTVDDLITVFTDQGGLLAERVTDLRDVRGRLVSELLGLPAPGVPQRDEPFVLVARDLAPADTALLDPAVCVALVTAEGGPTSHTAILARELGLPAIVAAPDALAIAEGTIVIVDGSTGEIIVDPTANELDTVAATALEVSEFTGAGATADGHPVLLLANVASPASVADAVAANAQGVGLFRTEFCFLDHTDAPSIAEQVAAYRLVFAAFPGKKVTIRTLDAGADKPLPFLTAVGEENPALGIRGYRTSWRQPAVLDDQLTAIATAAAAERAEVGVMAPMISTADEATEFATRCAAHGITTVGVMIETPSAAVTASAVLANIDFASLGTNDLTQYAMAADRLVGDLATLNDPWQPAVLNLIGSAAGAAVDARKPMGVCGEAAADPLLAIVLVGLGVSSLSMSPRAIARVAAELSHVSLATCRAVAAAALAAPSPDAARAAARLAARAADTDART